MVSVAGLARAQPAPLLRLELASDLGPALEPPIRCNADDIPDAPARALHLADGTVQLYASDQRNRVDAGPDLLHLRHRCPIVMTGAGRDDPAAYDDRAWIASPWTEDGHTIWALVHNEFHGHRRPALCPTGRYMDCWFNAITAAVSIDGGQSFHRAPGPALVAALPYRYDEVGLGHHGYFNPSNITTVGGAHYAFIFATSAGAQHAGNCLLRTIAIDRADAWRAWDGSAFSVAFIDPYRESARPEQHVCAPVALGSLRWPVTSLVRHAPSGLFLVLMQNTERGGGIYYATSPDLLNWSAPALLTRAIGLSSWTDTDPAPLAYPSLLDDTSPDRNFEIVGTRAQLFVTRFILSQGRIARERELVRALVSIRPEPRPNNNSGPT